MKNKIIFSKGFRIFIGIMLVALALLYLSVIRYMTLNNSITEHLEASIMIALGLLYAAYCSIKGYPPKFSSKNNDKEI